MTGPTTTTAPAPDPVSGARRRAHRRRAIATTVTLTALAAAVLLASLGAGDITVPVADVVRALGGRADRPTTTVVLTWRLPHALLALVLGAALGLSGAVFQTLTRNPLGSSDVIGFNTGAPTGALAVLLTGAAGYARTALGALVGGLATAALVYALGGRRSMATNRFVVTGIAVNAVLTSVNTWLMYGADTSVAARATHWTAGSLDALGWEQALPALDEAALRTSMIGYRHGGPAGAHAALAPTPVPDAVLERARDAVRASRALSLGGIDVVDGALTDTTAGVQLRPGPDGRWFPFTSFGEEWRPAAGCSADPVEAYRAARRARTARPTTR
ncbi:FecCD family ABC transporter permease [Streptomyces sp. NPDC001282]|uniref:FecCD family ABC transporter permease n=1 Tax=Streptomyces sp. NPDC001282 TaxID=3364557 RepID=UPI0036BF72BC